MTGLSFIPYRLTAATWRCQAYQNITLFQRHMRCGNNAGSAPFSPRLRDRRCWARKPSSSNSASGERACSSAAFSFHRSEQYRRASVADNPPSLSPVCVRIVPLFDRQSPADAVPQPAIFARALHHPAARGAVFPRIN
ncbi:hypothetical protein KCP78_14370 [Salmonella enterica subsp. enterica]|nr:hypothetical protein KCP78_14370 [Salmonella enterica subsp. enterica]